MAAEPVVGASSFQPLSKRSPTFNATTHTAVYLSPSIESTLSAVEVHTKHSSDWDALRAGQYFLHFPENAWCAGDCFFLLDAVPERDERHCHRCYGTLVEGHRCIERNTDFRERNNWAWPMISSPLLMTGVESTFSSDLDSFRRVFMRTTFRRL